MKAHNITSKSEITGSVTTTILGTYEGECADANITNANGLDITRPVWESVFNSEEYKHAIEQGWYIGYLGHPEDPNCMDFKDACIVMTECHIDDDGKVRGKFNLIDTPVGRVVMAFQKAGVVFGISVRGAGEIFDNSVDPDTFVFRGFDLVTFPAYPEAIPVFKDIAASTNIETQSKYKYVCKAISDNVDNITSVSAIDSITPFFANQSFEYKKLQNRRTQLSAKSSIDLAPEKVEAMTMLYVQEHQKVLACQDQIRDLTDQLRARTKMFNRKLKSIERISSSQLNQVDEQLAITASEGAKLRRVNSKLMNDRKKLIASNTQLKSKNLKYNHKISASTEAMTASRAEVSSLKEQLGETVADRDDLQTVVSNLGTQLSQYKADLKAALHIVEEYQNAYASLYASAVGADLNNITITATTSVSELQDKVEAAACATARPSAMADSEMPDIDILDAGDSEGLVVL